LCATDDGRLSGRRPGGRCVQRGLFSLPNMFRRFFAEGRLQSGLRADVRQEAGSAARMPRSFAADAFSGMAGLLTGVSLIGTLAMPLLVWAMAAGFVGDGRFDLAVDLAGSPSAISGFISLFRPAVRHPERPWPLSPKAGAVPVLMNLVFIAAMLLAEPHGLGHGLTLAWTTPVTGLVQLACGRCMPAPHRVSPACAGRA
jgi:putative peptidoglycan lipid II flippase